MTPPQSLSPGAVLADRFAIEDRLGAGGYGEVYAARDSHGPRQVALKILHHEATANDPRAVVRMRQEAEFLRAIDHPHIVRVFEVGHDPEYGEFLVMERVKGKGLHELIAEHGTLPSERVLRIGTQLLSALDASHTVGILHRDLKPENILIGQDAAGEDQLKLVDFGIAKGSSILNAEPDEGVTLVKTRVNSFVGTSRYAAPEMVVGDPLEPSADIFCVGLVLFEALTGKGLVKGTTRNELMHELVFPRPFDLSAAPDIWRPWLEKALEKSPSRRFQSCEEALEALAESFGSLETILPDEASITLEPALELANDDALTRSLEAPARSLFSDDALSATFPRATSAEPGDSPLPKATPLPPELDPEEIAETNQWESLDIDYAALAERRQRAETPRAHQPPSALTPPPSNTPRAQGFGAMTFISVALLTFLIVLAIFFALSSGGPL
ncbi:serine/threonine protein kinase [Lujinxingia vulgaris]|uniref:Serine/threonine protein kinase n=1 Tax=Lujinxingia vulgaris TaxID=2600176 RepID=A0A5C6XN61_9DELT|nr:serine/threonine-protein kinase [Lujinxingia vulgaris]TXD38829.1 serine/threonine protein kinase [Lujinxingia vulgaris]